MTAALVVLPNVELLVTQFLRQEPDVLELVGDNVFTVIPARFDSWPAVRVTRIGGVPRVQHPLVLDEALVQVDVWGGPKLMAERIAATIRAALDQRLPYIAPTGVLGGVSRFGALRDIPDPTFDPAKPRFIFDAQLLIRPPVVV